MRRLTHASGAPVADNLNIQTVGPRGPTLLQDVWLLEKLAHFDREAADACEGIGSLATQLSL
ncbi:MAG: catalase [Brevundimonas sp.]|nr:catalase [Brevundimonas sp.]